MPPDSSPEDEPQTSRPVSPEIPIESHGLLGPLEFENQHHHHTADSISQRPSSSQDDDKTLRSPDRPSSGEIDNEKPTDTKPLKRSSSTSFWTVISDRFILESLAIILSTGLLIAIVVILARQDKQPQPTWKLVSLNSVISWLGMLSKGCLLYAINEALGQLKWVSFAQKTRPMAHLRTFDSASRGFYGSVELVWTLRGRHVATWGSLAVILALAFDPFTQNLIHYYPNLAADPSQTARLANCSVYDNPGFSSKMGKYFCHLLDEGVWLTMTKETPYINPAMRSNIYDSIFKNDASRSWAIPQYLCSSGNCTWDPVATLGARSLCSDVSSHLSLTCHNESILLSDDPVTNCTVVLPGNNLTASFIPQTFIGTPLVLSNLEMLGSLTHHGTPLVYKNATIPPIQFIAPDSMMDQPWTLENGWKAVECSLELVVRSLHTEVVNGVFHEKTLATWTNASLMVGDNPDWYFCPTWGPGLGIQPNQTFKVAGGSQLTIQGILTDLFHGQVSVNVSAGLPYASDKSYASVQFQADSENAASSDLMEAFMNGSIPHCTARNADMLRCVMDNVAGAFTKSFRDSDYITRGSDPDKARMAVGEAKTSFTYITVHWQWVTLPVVVWMLGVATLVGTMWKTRLVDVPRWKNDPIPLLFLRAGGADRDIVAGVKGEETSCKADRVPVWLDRSDGKIVLRESGVE